MIVLSNRQYPMVQAFIDAGPAYYMTIEEAQKYDQRPFRSMLVRQWVAFRPGHGFFLTKAGRDSWFDYHGTGIFRNEKTRLLPLTSYFDPTAYRMKPSKKAMVHVMRKRQAA
jgi:hypothetical protein